MLLIKRGLYLLMFSQNAYSFYKHFVCWKEKHMKKAKKFLVYASVLFAIVLAGCQKNTPNSSSNPGSSQTPTSSQISSSSVITSNSSVTPSSSSTRPSSSTPSSSTPSSSTPIAFPENGRYKSKPKASLTPQAVVSTFLTKKLLQMVKQSVISFIQNQYLTK